MKHVLPALPYAYNALEPYIDAKTMEIHHTKHHQTYVDKLNEALHKPEGMDFHNLSVEELLKHITNIPESIRTAVRNHGGGHSNHSLFWESLSPSPTKPSATFMNELVKQFGSFDAFKQQFTDAALGRFGSGWAWLALHDKKLSVYSTANQDSPLMEGKIPLLGLDVWEHAYYLKWHSNRKGYAENWWPLVNWSVVEKRYKTNK